MTKFACFAYQLYIKRSYPPLLYFNGIDFILERFNPPTLHIYEKINEKRTNEIYQNLNEEIIKNNLNKIIKLFYKKILFNTLADLMCFWIYLLKSIGVVI